MSGGKKAVLAVLGIFAAVAFWAVGRSRMELRPLQAWDAPAEPAYMGSVKNVGFSEDGAKALTTRATMVALRDAADGRVLTAYGVRTIATMVSWHEKVNAAVLSRDGKRLAAADSFNGTMSVWDLESGRELYDFYGQEGSGTALAFSPDGRFLLFGRGNGTVMVRDAVSGRDVRVLGEALHDDFNNTAILALNVSLDGKTVAALGGHGIKVWELASGGEVLSPTDMTRTCHPGGLCEFVPGTCAAFSPDGRRVLVGGGDGLLRLYDLPSRKQVRAFKAHAAPVRAVSVAWDRRLAASSGADGTLRVWGLEGFERAAAQLPAKEGMATALAVSPHGDMLLVGTYGGAVLPFSLR